MVIKENKKMIEPGDKITAVGHTFEVFEVLAYHYSSGDNFGTPENFDIEFLDPAGSYHHWVSRLDGGYVIPKPCLSTTYVTVDETHSQCENCKTTWELSSIDGELNYCPHCGGRIIASN